MEQVHIFLTVQIFMLDTVQEQDPSLQLNNDVLETLKSDCDLIDSNCIELNLNGFTMDMENDNRDLVLEFHFPSLELMPDSVLLSIFPHVSNLEFRAEDDLVTMKVKYKNIFQ